MTKMLKYVMFIILAFSASGSLASVLKRQAEQSAPVPSKCPPKPESVPDLDLARYSGTWYQVQALPSFFQPNGTKCIKATYEKSGKDSISIWNTNVRPDGSYYEICGSADLVSADGQGEFQIKFSFSPAGSGMLILDTDYDNFAAVYSCIDFPVVGKFEYAWVLTRTPLPKPDVLARGREALSIKGVEVSKLETIEQGPDCLYEKPEGISCSEESKIVEEEVANESEINSESETDIKSESDAETETKDKVKTVTEIKSESDTKTEEESDTQTKIEITSEPETKTEKESETKTNAE